MFIGPLLPGWVGDVVEDLLLDAGAEAEEAAVAGDLFFALCSFAIGDRFLGDDEADDAEVDPGLKVAEDHLAKYELGAMARLVCELCRERRSGRFEFALG